MNLGARDGLSDDPLQFLLREPRHVEFALAVEMDPERPGTPGQRGKLRRKTPWFPEEHKQMIPVAISSIEWVGSSPHRMTKL